MTKSVAKKKLILTVAALAVTTGFFVYGTRAYYTDSVQSKGNIITVSSVNDVQLFDRSFDIHGAPLPADTPVAIMPGQNIPKAVFVENTGNSPIYVRVMLTPKVILAEKYADKESEIDLSLIGYDIDATNWIYRDGYYYYKEAVAGGDSTGNLLSAILFSPQMGNMYKDSRILLTVRMEVVQARYNGENVLDAVGWATPTEGGTP